MGIIQITEHLNVIFKFCDGSFLNPKEVNVFNKAI